MKKLRRFLAMMMTVIMTAGTLGDAGFTVFAADPEAEEAVSEDAVSEDDAVIPDEAVSGSDDEVTDDAVAEENEEEETEEEDLAEEETSDDKAVTKLIVNGTNMLAYGKYGHFLKPDGNAYSGSLSEAVKKPYMYYDNNGTLRLHDITLEGLYDAACGIEFEGDSLTIEIIGNNSIMLKKGVAGKNSYGIYADGDLTITSTKSDSGDRISGSLGICADSSISRWMSSIYTTGKFTAKSPEKTEYEKFSHGLYIDCDASSILRSGINPTGEIFSEGGMEFEDVNITVNAASHKDNSYAIGCLKAVNFISGEFQLNGALGDLVTDSKTCGIYTIDDITIGSEAAVDAYAIMLGSGNSGQGVASRGGKLTVSGILSADGNTKAVDIHNSKETGIVLDGTFVYIPDEGKVFSANGADTTISEYNNKPASSVRIMKGRYYDIWIAGERLNTERLKYEHYLTDGTITFEPEVSNLYLDKVTYLNYSMAPSPSAKEKNITDLIYTEIPVTLRGDAKLSNKNAVLSACNNSIVDLQGAFDFKSTDSSAIILKNAILAFNSVDQVVNLEGENGSAISGYEGSSVEIYYGTINAKGAQEGIFCLGDILIKGGELNAEGGTCAIQTLFTGNEITLAKGLDIIVPEGGKIKTAKDSSNRDYCTVVDKDDNVAKKAKIASLAVAASALNPVPAGIETASKVILVKGQKFTLPGSGWKVVDDKTSKKFVSVSKKGVLKAKKKTGDSDVAKITNGERTIEITVVQPKFNNKSIKVSFKGTYIAQDVLGFVPGSADLPVAYFSNAPEILEVDSMGHLIPLTAGTATVTAYVNGTAYKCKVKVKEEKIATERPIYMIAGKTRTLKIKNVKLTQYNSSDTNIATVDNKGKVTAVAPGKCYIVAADKELAEYYLNIFVEDITIENPEIAAAKSANKYNATMTAGQKIKIKFKNVEQTVMFKSNKGEVAYVNEAGEICAQKPGVAKLTGKINGKTVTIKVTVNEAP